MANRFPNPFKKDVAAGEPVMGAAGAAAAVPPLKGSTSRRGRRIMTVVLVLLFILLLLATAFLYNMIRPKGDIKSAGQTGGVTWVRSIYGIGSNADQLLYTPAAVAFDKSGNMIVPNVGLDAVRGLVFNSSGIYQRMFWGSKAGYLRYPTAVDVAPDGRMYFVQSATDEILVTDAKGTTTERVMRVEEPTAIDVTSDRIAIGSRAGWVVTDLDFNILIGPVGQQGTGKDQYDAVTGIAIDKEDNIYTVDTYNNRISKFDKNGEKVWEVQTGAPSNQSDTTSGVGHVPESDTDAKLAMPTSAQFDKAGRLLVCDVLGFQIAAFDTEDGKFLGKWGTAGNGEGEFLYPAAIAYDPVHDWIAVADANNNRVQIVRVPGTGGGAVGAINRALSGPLRACLIPLLLLIVAIAAWVYWKWRERRNRKQIEDEAAALAAASAGTITAE